MLSAVVLCAASPAGATAQSRRHRAPHSKRTAAAAAAGRPLYKGALLEDADSGRVLMAYNADMEWPPASMAKMMLLLVAQEQINAGRFSGNDPVRISERAAHTGGSRVGLKEGDVYPLRELMKAALVKSANDAAVAVAEKIGGSVEAMVRMMNERAQELGMTHTEYQTVDGLPPRPTHDVDRTTAYDLATVGRAIIRETNLLMWSGQEKMDFDNGVAILNNTNHLIGHFEGCDGLKTGFTSQAGFNVTATAKRGDMRLIAVILGAPSNTQRFAQAAKADGVGLRSIHRGVAAPVGTAASGPRAGPSGSAHSAGRGERSQARGAQGRCRRGEARVRCSAGDRRAGHDGRTAGASDRAGRGTSSNGSDGDKPDRVHPAAYAGGRGVQRVRAAAE